MLRIEKESNGCITRLQLSGRIQADRIACIRSAMNSGCARKILDLSEVTLVDIAAVRFLLGCENEGIELARCPPYVREWLLRERAEGAQIEATSGNWLDRSASPGPGPAMDYGLFLSDNIIRTSRK